MPDDIEFPDEWSEWIHDIQDGNAHLPWQGYDFIEENFPGWVEAADGSGISGDTAALGIDFGYDDPSDIGSITIHAEGDHWWIEIDGAEYELNEGMDIWDWYDLAIDYDIDFERDIDTG